MPAPSLTLPLSMHELHTLIALLGTATDSPHATPAERRVASRLLIRATQLLHKMEFDA